MKKTKYFLFKFCCHKHSEIALFVIFKLKPPQSEAGYFLLSNALSSFKVLAFHSIGLLRLWLRYYCPHPKDGGRYCFQFVCQSTCQVWGGVPHHRSVRGGTPSKVWLGGYPIPGLAGEGGTPSQVQAGGIWGTPQTWDGVPPGTWDGIPPRTWDGVPPRPGMGYPHTWDGVPPRPGMGTPPRPGTGTPRTWDGVPPRPGT